MVWFAVDDTFSFHPKVLRAGNPALGLWVRAGAWCSQQLTNGFVDAHLALALGTPAEIEALVSNGLWLVVENGFQFNDWCDYNPSATTVMEQRERNRAKQQRHRDRANAARALDAGTNPERNRLHNPPVTPTPPLPSPKRTTTNSPTPDGVEPRFREFWSVYPRRVRQDRAKKAFVTALRRADYEDILAGAVRYRDDPNREDEFTAHPSTWLNGGGWDDDPLPARGGGRLGPAIRRDELLPFEYPEGD